MSEEYGNDEVIIRNLIKENDNVIDIGGNVGDWSRKVLKLSGNVKLDIYEANPELIGKLNELKKLNPETEVFNLACSNEMKKDVDFCVYEGEMHGMSGFNRRIPEVEGNCNLIPKMIKVNTTRLDRIYHEKIDFIKIDCEGFDSKVIEGLTGILDNIKAVQFEYGGSWQENGMKVETCFESLKDFPFIYKMPLYEPMTRVEWEPELEDYKHCDYIFTKQEVNIVKDFWEKVHKENNIRYLSDTTIEQTVDTLEIKDLIKKDLRVLEIGVGKGDMTKYLFDLGCKIDVLEISDAALNKIRKYIRYGFLTHNDQLPPNEYDLIISFLVTQHIDDKELVKQLKQTIKSLKKDGIFALQFAYALDKDEMKDDSVEKCKQGEVKRSLEELTNLITDNNGIIVNKFDKGEYPSYGMGWVTVHIKKKVEDVKPKATVNIKKRR